MHGIFGWNLAYDRGESGGFGLLLRGVVGFREEFGGDGAMGRCQG